MPGLAPRRSIVHRSAAAVALLIGLAGLTGVAAPPEADASGQPEVEPGVALTQEPLAGDITEDDLWLEPEERLAQADAEALLDIVQPAVPLASQFVAAQTEFTGDPLKLAVFPLESRRYTRSTDKIGVYLCTWNGADADVQLGQVTNTLNGAVKSYYQEISRGSYNPVFTARKEVTIPSGQVNHFACAEKVADAAIASTGDNGALAVMDNGNNGGLATSGLYCQLPCANSKAPTTFPANNRWGVVDGGSLSGKNQNNIPPNGEPHLTTAVHEIGHMLGFPHSYSGLTASQYDNPIDVMSGNRVASLQYRSNDPYATPAWNRYRAGWVDPNQVVIYRGGIKDIKIAPAGVSGTQMVVIPTSTKYSFLTLDARRPTGIDGDYPKKFRGVTAHYVEQLGNCVPVSGTAVCWGTQSKIFSYPPAPDNLRNVTAVGESKRMNVNRGAPLVAKGTKMRVLSADQGGFTVRLIGFSDTGNSVFLDDVIWLAEKGITKGCDATKFCPNNTVTRGQMAAFLVRALNLPKAGDQGFGDTAGNVFKADIDALAKAGITKGCNPPRNTKFCPNEPVTRGQMAAFLVRAFSLPKAGNQGFTDVGGSVFRADVNALAKADITKGCNPPGNTKFCPNDSVTRGQMAAFLKRGAKYL